MAGRIVLWGGGTRESIEAVAKPILGTGKDIPWGWFPMATHGDPPAEPGDVIVSMGGQALALFKAGGVFKGNLGIEKLRGAPGNWGGAHVLITRDPVALAFDAEAKSQIQWDLRLARRLIKTGSTLPILGKYEWVQVEQFEALVDEWCARPEPVPATLDLETTGFFPFYPDKYIVTYQISAEEGTGHVLHHSFLKTAEQRARMRASLDKLLNHRNIRLRGANLKFDLNWLWWKLKLTCSNFNWDTMLVGSMLDENRSNSLEWHAKEHTDLGGYDDHFNRTYDKGRMDLVPVGDDLLTYAGGDVDSCLRVSNHQISQMKGQQHLARLYREVVHPAARAFEKIEQRGVLVSPERYSALAAELDEHAALAHSDALKCLPARLRAKHDGKLDLSRAQLVADFMFSPLGLNLTPKLYTEKKGAPSTAAKHFKMFADVEEAQPFLEAYRRWSSATKIKSTYVEGFLEDLRPGNRFHATYLLFNGSAYESDDDDSGTVTGRLAALNPAMQTVPKHPKPGQSKFWAKELRKCFIAPPGMVMWEADFSQGELRVVACVADEGNMLEAYRQGKDLHCLLGSQFAEVEYDEFLSWENLELKKAIYKEFRQKAKSANFGLLYGMSAEGFRDYARDQYGVNMSLAEAELVHRTFFHTYPGLSDYHEAMTKFARNRGYVTSPLGRVRRLPLIHSPDGYTRGRQRRQAINSPIQGCLSDLCLFAIVYIEREFAEQGVQVIGMIHDAIIGYMPADRAEELAPKVREMMSNLPIREKLGWNHQIPFPADMEIGPDWGSLSKIK